MTGRRSNTVRGGVKGGSGGGAGKKKLVSPHVKSRRPTKHPPSPKKKGVVASPRSNRQPSKPKFQPKLEQVLSVSSSSIHAPWKKGMGGLLRYYINLPQQRGRFKEAEREVEDLYNQSGFSEQETIDALVQVINEQTNQKAAKERPGSWLSVDMVVLPRDPIILDDSNTTVINRIRYDVVQKGKGIVLHTETRRGEGPARAEEMWNVVLIPEWAIGLPYEVFVRNFSPLDLTSKMSIDDHVVARNVGILANDGQSSHTTRTIRPDNHRYFESHQWILQPANRITVNEAATKINDAPIPSPVRSTAEQLLRRRQGHRYNGLRHSYQVNRVSETHFPDPSTRGWTFTGSNVESSVEFFERRLNNGGLVLMDFYYTTGTVKTSMDHPTMGHTQLFRRCKATPELFQQILENPRFHSGIGYRRSEDAPMQLDHDDNEKNSVDTTEIDDNNADGMDEGEIKDSSVAAGHEMEAPTFYAKNDMYDFEVDGHENRQSAMKNLQTTAAFQAWEEATCKDWACIDAKFYVATRQYVAPRRTGKHTGKSHDGKRETLPSPTPVVDVQAASGVGCSTKFESGGRAAQARGVGGIRFKAIHGLKDDPTWATGPVFRHKLYYRPVFDIKKKVKADSGDIEEGEVCDDDEMDEEGAKDEEVVTQDIRDSKKHQLERWLAECKVEDKDEANFRAMEAQKGMDAATSVATLDKHLHDFFVWQQSRSLALAQEI